MFYVFPTGSVSKVLGPERSHRKISVLTVKLSEVWVHFCVPYLDYRVVT